MQSPIVPKTLWRIWFVRICPLKQLTRCDFAFAFLGKTSVSTVAAWPTMVYIFRKNLPQLFIRFHLLNWRRVALLNLFATFLRNFVSLCGFENQTKNRCIFQTIRPVSIANIALAFNKFPATLFEIFFFFDIFFVDWMFFYFLLILLVYAEK